MFIIFFFLFFFRGDIGNYKICLGFEIGVNPFYGCAMFGSHKFGKWLKNKLYSFILHIWEASDTSIYYSKEYFEKIKSFKKQPFDLAGLMFLPLQ